MVGISVVSYFVVATKRPYILMALGAAFLCLVTVSIYTLLPEIHHFATYTVRRIMFVPAYLNFMWYDFFSTHPFMFWSDSKLSLGLVKNPYGVPAPLVDRRLLLRS